MRERRRFYQKTKSVRRLVERVSLIDAAAPDADHVLVPLHRSLQESARDSPLQPYMSMSFSVTRDSNTSIGMKLLPTVDDSLHSHLG